MATHSSTLAWKIPWTEEPFAATLTVINWKSEARQPKTTTVAWKNADVDSQRRKLNRFLKVKSLSRVRLCDPMDCSLPGFSIHGISQSRVLEWVAISFSPTQELNLSFPNCRQELPSETPSEVTQSCLTLCDPMDCSLPGFSIHGIFQARVLEEVAISFSKK